MRRVVLPVAVGLAVAVATFALIEAGGDDGDRRAQPTQPPTTPATAATRDGRAVFVAEGCGSCHTFRATGSNGPIGPDLDQVIPTMTPAAIRAKLLAPESSSIMPSFRGRIPDEDLDELVGWLKASAG